MMATTIVALHLDGRTATIGHVGDSRLYRLTPAGQLLRETEDHSVVEEEVRAGRMTPEQAANHPSKNVISRALGAENDVEVDLKVIEVEDGTQFLLCTDGITRHVPDYELRQLLIINQDLGSVCEELKRRCYERGAEDNLTAVLVRVGEPIPASARLDEMERTISPETDAHSGNGGDQTLPAAAPANGHDPLVPPSRVAFPAPISSDALPLAQRLNVAPPPRKSFARTLGRAFLLLIFLGAVVGGFYAGRRYKGAVPYMPAATEPVPAPVATPIPPENPVVRFDRARRTVDTNPAGWLANQMKTDLAAQGVQNPLDSANPEFLYLYGRASLLTGNNEEAAQAFDAAIAKADQTPSPENAVISKEATIALAAVTLRWQGARPQALTRFTEMLQKPAPSESPSAQ
jgi:hypothetical protein